MKHRVQVLVFFLSCSSPALAEAQPSPAYMHQTLAPRSGPAGPTMFTVMPSAETGVVTENHYSDPQMWAGRYHEFEVGAIGTGVAIGDYDGDGRPDIFVVNKTENCRLFRNLGNWKFEDVTEKAGVGDLGEAAKIWKQGVTFADVNNDGLLDIYVCRFAAPNLLYINQGDGTFREEAKARGLAINDASVMAAFCDYDRDGWLDVFVQTNILDAAHHPGGQRSYLLHNNRDGTFTDVTDRAGITGEAQGHSAMWWDYDNDGWPDLYVSSDFSPPDKLYHNNRDGTFTDVTDRVVPHTPFSSMGSDVADVDNDGRLDLFVADMAATNHQKDQRTMANMRAQAGDPPEGSHIAPQYPRNALFLNTGTGYCQEAAILCGLGATDWSWAPRFEDLDNDGRVDLFVTNGMHREAHNADLMSRMMLAQSEEEKIRIERSAPVFKEAHLAYRNLGNYNFAEVGAQWGLNQRGVAFGVAFGDLDGDGDLDLIYSNFEGGVTLLRNDSQMGHRLTVALHGTNSNRFGIGATVRIQTAKGIQVRQLILARGVLSSSEPIVHFGLGEETRIQQLDVIWPNGTFQTFKDLASDERLTITEPIAATVSPIQEQKSLPLFSEVSGRVNLSILSRESKVDETSQQKLLPMRQNRRGPSLAVGDLNNDGIEDIVLGGTALDPLRLILSEDKNGFSKNPISVGGLNSTLNEGPVLVLNTDGGAKSDILVTMAGNTLPAGIKDYQPKLYKRDSQGAWKTAEGVLPNLAISAGVLATADFNRDGQLDLFVGGRVSPGEYPRAPQSALLINHEGRFEDVTETMVPELRRVGMVTSALWSDVDGDGWVDLILTLEWGQVKCFRNNHGETFSDWTEKLGFTAAGTGLWTSIATADFNSDGRPDYVIGNIGLNTLYQADSNHPLLLFDGDFKGDGSSQLIEGYYEGDKLYPRRSRRDLGAVLPAVLKRFPRNDFYARATLEELLGADKLAKAEKYSASELRSGVLLSQPDGTYRFEPLPRIAQIAPIQGLVAGDFDGDGHPDIYAVQNSYSPIPSVGRFDGGLSQLLLGDGRGHFSPIPPAQSGLIVPGDAKALVAVDLNDDGWVDFVVSRNSGTTLAFLNAGAVGRKPLCVRLRGPAGNPTAIGARITMELEDGTKQMAEVLAGSGYGSQSSAASWFGYRVENPPRIIRVRWPDGKMTQEAIPPNVTKITVPFNRR